MGIKKRKGKTGHIPKGYNWGGKSGVREDGKRHKAQRKGSRKKIA